MNFSIVRTYEATAQSGFNRSTYHLKASEGLALTPFKIGSRASGLFQYEIDTINRAKAMEASENEIKEIVRALEDARGADAATIDGLIEGLIAKIKKQSKKAA